MTKELVGIITPLVIVAGAAGLVIFGKPREEWRKRIPIGIIAIAIYITAVHYLR